MLLFFLDKLLHGALLFLQLHHHLLLLSLLLFQVLLFGLALTQFDVLRLTVTLNLLLLGRHLCLLDLHSLALCFLIGGIFLHETRATIQLVDVLGAEHKHHLALLVAVAIHIAHRLHIALLTLGQLALKLFLLGIQQHQRAVQRGDMRADGVNQALLIVNLAAQHQHVLHLLLHPAVQLGLLLLLFLNILTQLLLGSLHLLPFGQRFLGC